jgi:hypothetical protein
MHLNINIKQAFTYKDKGLSVKNLKIQVVEYKFIFKNKVTFGIFL